MPGQLEPPWAETSRHMARREAEARMTGSMAKADCCEIKGGGKVEGAVKSASVVDRSPLVAHQRESRP